MVDSSRCKPYTIEIESIEVFRSQNRVGNSTALKAPDSQRVFHGYSLQETTKEHFALIGQVQNSERYSDS
jgi:hypothetical protein